MKRTETRIYPKCPKTRAPKHVSCSSSPHRWPPVIAMGFGRRTESAESCAGVPIGTSDWRQAYPEIHREFAINQDIVGTLNRTYANKTPFKH